MLSSLLAWVLVLIAAGLAAYTGWRLEQPSLLGTPLPPIPKLVQFEGVDADNASVVERRIPLALLEFLVPQPDGVPPLRYPYRSEYLGFNIMHPMATEMVTYPLEQFLADGVAAQGFIRLDQPVNAIKYTKHKRRDGESVTEYASRIRFELEQKGAVFYEDCTPFTLSSYHFEHLEFERESEEGEVYSHFLYIGPSGDYVIVLDYFSTPPHHELARLQANKIVGSFKPTYELTELYRREQQGLLAGSRDATAPAGQGATL